MFGSTSLEVAIGLVFCYASVALIVSSLHEAIASALKLRSNSLLAGVKALLNDPQFTGLAREVYNHALVSPRDAGNAKTERELTNKPSYVDPMHLALAVIDTVQTAPGDFRQLGEDIAAIRDPQLRQLLQGMYVRATGKAESLQGELAAWFDAGMARVSGAYKRQTQLSCFLIGLLIAGLFNIDSFHLFATMWRHPALATQLATQAPAQAGEAVAALQTLPIGWADFPPRLDAGFLLTIAGWLVTASSALFGAPFWFDLLQKLTQLRGAGKPDNASGGKS